MRGPTIIAERFSRFVQKGCAISALRNFPISELLDHV